MFTGVVVTGHGRGRTLGFPTANIELFDATAMPPDGVYSSWIRRPPDTGFLGATVSVGENPTFDDVDGKQVEAYIHDLDESLYGCTVEVHLAMHLRPMLKFPTLAELIAQTAADVQRSRTVLAGSRPPDVD